MDQKWLEIILAIIALFVGVTICIRVISKKKSYRNQQTGNVVGGDQAGRDINKKR
jgi:hypothetical protein